MKPLHSLLPVQPLIYNETHCAHYSAVVEENYMLADLLAACAGSSSSDSTAVVGPVE
jgi:hypothetical protein